MSQMGKRKNQERQEDRPNIPATPVMLAVYCASPLTNSDSLSLFHFETSLKFGN